MRILVNNLLEDAVITSDDPTDAFPISNIISDSPTDRGQFINYVVIDLGSAKAVNSVGYLNNTDSITIEANATDVWTSPTFSQALTSEVTFISETFRYWRIVIVGAENRLGYFYLGNYLAVSEDDGTHNLDYEDTDIKNPTSAGAIFPTPGVQLISENYVFPIMSDTERFNFLDWWNTVDRVSSHFIVPFEDNLTEYPPYFGNILNAPFKRKFLDWSLTLSIKEAK